MIVIDQSELRSNSRLRRYEGRISHLFTTVRSANNLEELTGADLMLTPLDTPLLASTLPVHVRAGCLLVQLKFGSDLLSSVGERMKDSLLRMRAASGDPKHPTPQHQCILMPVGALGLKTIKGRDYATMDGKARPKRTYIGVQNALHRWTQRGGVVHHLNRANYLPQLLREMYDYLGQKETFWPTIAASPDSFEPDDILLDKVTDWRPVFAAVSDGIGPVKATKFRNAMLAAGYADCFAQALTLATSTPAQRKEWGFKAPGWGDRTYERVRGDIFKGGENLMGTKYLSLELKEK